MDDAPPGQPRWIRIRARRAMQRALPSDGWCRVEDGVVPDAGQWQCGYAAAGWEAAKAWSWETGATVLATQVVDGTACGAESRRYAAAVRGTESIGGEPRGDEWHPTAEEALSRAWTAAAAHEVRRAQDPHAVPQRMGAAVRAMVEHACAGAPAAMRRHLEETAGGHQIGEGAARLDAVDALGWQVAEGSAAQGSFEVAECSGRVAWTIGDSWPDAKALEALQAADEGRWDEAMRTWSMVVEEQVPGGLAGALPQVHEPWRSAHRKGGAARERWTGAMEAAAAVLEAHGW